MGDAFEELGIYKIVYSAVDKKPEKRRKCLKQLVGAGRFELPTPCAQGRFRSFPDFVANSASSKSLRFKGLCGTLLKAIEPC